MDLDRTGLWSRALGWTGSAIGGAIIGALALGWPVLLAVDNDTHWVAAVGRLAARVLVADSADGAVVQSLDEKKLLDRAVCAGYIEGIVIGEKLAP